MTAVVPARDVTVGSRVQLELTVDAVYHAADADRVRLADARGITVAVPLDLALEVRPEEDTHGT